jgi:hypothetical protein
MNGIDNLNRGVLMFSCKLAKESVVGGGEV